MPTVTVVIPTRNRPDLVIRAINSALAQTMDDLEVIVVIDGPDPATKEAVDALGEARVRVVERETSGGAPAARNLGVQLATAPWVGFLDDDDEWLPGKLTAQLEVAEKSPVEVPIVATCLKLRTPRAEFVLPRRLPEEGEPTSEYLTRRRGLFHGDGFIQTSTIMAPTELLRKVPFTVGLRRFQELDWTLRALQEPGVALVYAAEPLVIWYADENRQRISLASPWQQQVDWLRETRPRVTKKAYAALAMSAVSSMAVASKSPKVALMLLREAHKGRPGLLDYVTFAQIWLVPSGLRVKLRDAILGRREKKK
jgi:glycosyltransferase involved in cell wall biosynthesis